MFSCLVLSLGKTGHKCILFKVPALLQKSGGDGVGTGARVEGFIKILETVHTRGDEKLIIKCHVSHISPVAESPNLHFTGRNITHFQYYVNHFSIMKTVILFHAVVLF